jgi:hypothetical protein
VEYAKEETRTDLLQGQETKRHKRPLVELKVMAGKKRVIVRVIPGSTQVLGAIGTGDETEVT